MLAGSFHQRAAVGKLLFQKQYSMKRSTMEEKAHEDDSAPQWP